MIVYDTAEAQSVSTNVRRRARQAIRWAAGVGRRLGVLPYQPEHWTTGQWAASYANGSVDYYGDLDELARYSMLVGYLGWIAGRMPDRLPSVLDVGCGTGLLRKRLDAASFSTYVGVDLSETAIAQAHAQAHPRSRFLVGDVSALDLDRFDVVVLNEVLYCVPDTDTAAFLGHIRGLLRPQGFLLVSMWRHPGDRTMWRKVIDAFPVVDRVQARNRGNSMNPRGWMIACCKDSTEDAEAQVPLAGEADDAGQGGAGSGAVEG